MVIVTVVLYVVSVRCVCVCVFTVKCVKNVPAYLAERLYKSMKVSVSVHVHLWSGLDLIVIPPCPLSSGAGHV